MCDCAAASAACARTLRMKSSDTGNDARARLADGLRGEEGGSMEPVVDIVIVVVVVIVVIFIFIFVIISVSDSQCTWS